ncbi:MULTISPECIES: hypothetical protein [Oceanotoga]|jgi:hypothetical protein|uniref:Fibronectin type-III domain-containing protein n=1 Tax=Oceanotoga teriensis TaxID=515440 RepID=A0AA45C4Q6_9BACT|nr:MULTISPECIES: hypothetical protein [Oceanotoga]MDN5341866.1 hypothetical protein [Oceanotoga sp.]MDO7976653.1 hypothetical protein [Oceanotoga teriensis]PWJ87017.1 hypothetical protein C7380_12722 [Oceanotoga teriensis]
MNEDKKNNNEFEELVESSNYDKKNKEKIIIFSSLGVILIFTVIIVFSVLFVNKKYNVNIQYTIKTSEFREPIEKIKVELLGEKTVEKEFSLSDNIKMENIEKGNYTINISAIGQNDLKFYYGSVDSFIDEDKNINLELDKSTIKYSIDTEWEETKAIITLPDGYDEYVVVEKDQDQYKIKDIISENKYELNSDNKTHNIFFAAVKDKKVFDYSQEIIITKNNPPNSPNILYPEEGQNHSQKDIIFTWEASDPDKDLLTYDIYLSDGTTQKNIANGLNNNSFGYNSLELNKNYTLKVVAKDSQNAKSEQSIKFTTTKYEKSYLYSPSGKYGVTIYEVYDPKNPKEISNIKTSGNVTDTVLINTSLFILRINDGITIADVKNPETPIIKKNLELDEVDGLKATDKYAYIRFKDGRVSVYSIEKNPYDPKFLGFTDIKYYGSKNPEIKYIQKNIRIEVPIIQNEYALNYKFKNKIYIGSYILVVGSEEARTKINNNLTYVYDNLSLIFTNREIEDFKDYAKIDSIKSQLKNALNEFLKMSEDTGVKEVKLSINKIN